MERSLTIFFPSVEGHQHLKVIRVIVYVGELHLNCFVVVLFQLSSSHALSPSSRPCGAMYLLQADLRCCSIL
jgi:hypothetical protein